MKSTVVIVGGGHGGTLVAKSLDGEAEVTGIDPPEMVHERKGADLFTARFGS